MPTPQHRPGTPRPRGGAGAPSRGSTGARPAPGRPRGTGGSRPAPRPGQAPGWQGQRLALAQPQRRLRWMLLLILMAMTLFMGRAFQLQAFDSQAYASRAAAQMTHTLKLEPQRGSISDRFGTVMAATVPAVKIVADPSSIARNGVDKRVTMTERQQRIAAENPKAIAAVLARHLGRKPADYLPALTAKDSRGDLLQYKVVVPQVDASTWNQIRRELAAGGTADGVKAPYWYGLYKEDNPRRIYPSGSVGGNLVGVYQNGQARTGLERSLDEQLAGTPGQEQYESSVYGRIPLGTDVLVPAKDGTDFTLTIDATLQQVAEAALARGVTGAAASTGTAIVMDVKTGEVLADASIPSYDPNDISRIAAQNSMLNRSVESQYEPGSVQKVLTMAALADEGLVKADTHVVVPSKLASGGGYIRDSFSHDTLHLTARGVIANSSNIGTSILARQMDKQSLADHLRSFGLGQRTGVELPNETPGIVPDGDMADYTRDQIAFGQGLAVNAMQMTAAVAAVVNDGVYNPPTLVKSATDSEGKAVALRTREPRRVISKEASAEVRDMMESVIRLRPEVRAIDGYRTIGKSGTSERPDGKGGYSGYTASFALAGPAEDPRILVYVVIDQPERQRQGSEVALPVANEIMKLALPRYGALPSTTEAPDKPTKYQP